MTGFAYRATIVAAATALSLAAGCGGGDENEAGGAGEEAR